MGDHLLQGLLATACEIPVVLMEGVRILELNEAARRFFGSFATPGLEAQKLFQSGSQTKLASALASNRTAALELIPATGVPFAVKVVVIPLEQPRAALVVQGAATYGDGIQQGLIEAQSALAEQTRALAISRAEVEAKNAKLRRLAGLLERERFTLSQIIEAIPDVVLFVDASTGKLLSNRAFQELLGVPLDPSQGREQYVGRLLWPDGRPLNLDELPSSQVLRHLEPSTGELQVLHPDGRRIPVWWRAAPVRSPDGDVIGAVVVIRDVSVQKELQRLREEFAAMIVHDLRNPIQVMLANLELLRRTVQTGDVPALAMVDRLAQSVVRLSAITNDLLDLSRVELARTRLEKVLLDLPSAVAEFLERSRPLMGRHSESFQVRGRPPLIPADPTRLEQILGNLLENAAKHSDDQTPIEVSIAELGDGVEISRTRLRRRHQPGGAPQIVRSLLPGAPGPPAADRPGTRAVHHQGIR